MASSRTCASFIIIITLLSAFNWVYSNQCTPNGFVYGKNEIIDQLMVCSLSKSYDLDLTPRGEYVKSTSKVLVEQGLSNKTSILYAKLSGLWTGKRAKFVESGWKCDANKTTVSSVIEFNGLSLEIVEKVEIPIHRNQHKLAIHRPCKTFDLPVWMCRSSKPIYRTTKTWVNSAYFNLTLSQAKDADRASVESLSLMFTCPETFKQKITHSPSAMYILTKYMQNLDQTSQKDAQKKRDINLSSNLAYSSSQDGKGPTMPPYYNLVKLITTQVSDSLRFSLDSCLQVLDLDLSLANEYESFRNDKFPTSRSKESSEVNDKMQCSNERYLAQRIESGVKIESVELSGVQQVQDVHHLKRSQFMLNYPDDPNQLLKPYNYYHENANRMLDDEDGGDAVGEQEGGGGE